TNKVKATINQIEAGAYHGAVSKLENDLKNTVMSWITEEYEISLIEKIDEIISLIKGEVPPEDTTPPNIASVLRTPEAPNYDESVTVKAQVEDEQSGVDIVILSYSTNDIDWNNVTMSLEDTLYTAEIHAQTYNTHVSYKVYACDKAGNPAVSDSYSYTVTDSYPPTISWVERSPISPNHTDTVLVTANVSEPQEASGIQLTILNYFDGTTSTNATMTLKEETVYEANIPAFPYDTTVEYKIYASDTAENWAVSGTHSYIVGDESPPIVRIDKPTPGSYVKEIVEIVIFVNDTNFEKAELSINSTAVESWTSTGEHTYNWNTATYIDGVYILNLTAQDGAGNLAKAAVTVTVDQTLPLASINTPIEGSHIKSWTMISVTGTDDSFEKLQLFVNHILVLAENTSGTYSYFWDTLGYADGAYPITLEVYDKANNTATIEISVTVDNTLPTAEIRQPLADTHIKGAFSVILYGHDINFWQMELHLDDNLIETWTTSGEQIYVLDTTEFSDGSYPMKLTVSDKAGNLVEEQHVVTVDNTIPTAIIDEPDAGAFLKGLVDINFTGEDANLEAIRLSIDVTDVLTSEAAGTYTHVWNTSNYLDDDYMIKLEVSDKAGNTFAVEISCVVDNTPPDAEIRQPLDRSYIRGILLYFVFGSDTNFDEMKVFIGDELSKTWTTAGEYSNAWTTLKYSDGVYQIRLVVSDKSGNSVEKIITATVDNTLPIAVITTPTGEAFLRGTTDISVTGEDSNFEEMHLKIDGVTVESWIDAGSQTYSWNTMTYLDGDYTLELAVFDKAGNSKGSSMTITLDNTSPIVEAPTWQPEEPSTGEYIAVAARVSDPQPSSGIENVTLWYRDTTTGDWQSVTMSLSTARKNWTAAIPAQSMETEVEFWIEAFDKAGNKASTDETYKLEVTGPVGLPLAWIIAIILLVLAATIAAIYLWRRRRRKRQSINSSRVEDYKLTILLCV
ncbi:MAG: Ig-like domain repeat protein, partial [Candidatus Bathyarchaeota archaeon]